MSATTVALATEMRELKLDIDAREAALKPIKERYDAIRKRELFDAMSDAGISQVKLEDGGLFYLSSKLVANVPAANAEQFHQWLRDNGFAALLKTSVNPSTLNAWVKEQRAEGTQLPEFVSVFEEPLVAMRK